MIGALMLDIAGTELTKEDIELLQAPQVGGMILFARNIESPQQVRALTDHMRHIRPDILIAVDQEGGRVQRLKSGFTLLPAMGRFGELYITQPQKALELAEQCGWLMATEVLAVGIDFSFAPVLDLNSISDVIGDRGFSKNIEDIAPLAGAFMRGMKKPAWQILVSTSRVTVRSKPIHMSQPQLTAVAMTKFTTMICKASLSLCLSSMRSCLHM